MDHRRQAYVQSQLPCQFERGCVRARSSTLNKNEDEDEGIKQVMGKKTKNSDDQQ